MAGFNYAVEIRNKSGTLLEILQPDIFSIYWQYDTVGGCGEAEVALRRDFDDYGDINLDYDARIYRIEEPIAKAGDVLDAALPMLLGGDVGKRELRWRGFVREIIPVLDTRESVRLRCAGYVRQLEYIAVPNLTRSSEDVGVTARYIIDTYVVGGSQIKRTDSLNLVKDQNVVISATGLKFDTSAYEALKTLADIGGNVEWGVRPGLNPSIPEDVEIFFLARSSTIKQTWIIGDRVKYYEPAKNTDEIVHRVYLRGKGAFTATVTVDTGVETGRYKERVMFVPAIANASDATLWGTAFFSRFGSSQQKARLVLSAVDDWIENDPHGISAMPPLGKLRLFGGALLSIGGAVLPSTLDFELAGTLGATTDESFRINSITYRPTPNGLKIEIDLGEKRGILSDLLRSIEFKLSELRQGV